jgi:hypothetical protein
MPRVSQAESEQRQRFALDTWKRLWKELPPGKKVSVAAVNKEIEAKFGSKMRGDTLYSLRDQAIKELRESGYADVAEPRRRTPNGSAKPQPLSQARVVTAGTGPAPVPASGGLEARRGPGRPLRAATQTQMPPQVVAGLEGLSPTQAIKKVFESIETGWRMEYAGDNYVLLNRV